MNNSRVEQAVTNFVETELSCSQAVFSTYADLFDLEKATAMKIADAFGGGISGTAQTCGAVCGALMAIGLKYGFAIGNDLEAKKITRSLSKEFLQRFTEQNNTTSCYGLLPVNISTEEGSKEANEKNYFKIKCPNFVRSAATILEQIFDANK